MLSRWRARHEAIVALGPSDAHDDFVGEVTRCPESDSRQRPPPRSRLEPVVGPCQMVTTASGKSSQLDLNPEDQGAWVIRAYR